jgi:molybdenum cofactor cytidylyltransferase
MIESRFSLGVVILGAGRSARMGRPKLLLPWGKTSVLGHLLDQWRGVGADQIMVVHASQDRVILQELDRLAVPPANRVTNPNVERGMFSSIVCAAQSSDWKVSLTHWAIVLGDQPHLRRDTLLSLASFARERRQQVCQPQRNGRHCHPVALPRDIFKQLGQSSATTLKEFLRTQHVASFECNDPGLDLDIDRPDDYERALALAGLIAC